MSKAHDIKEVTFYDRVLHIRIDGTIHEFDLASHSPLLAVASQSQLENMEVSPSGYGLHWPELDEDLSIDGLLGIPHRPSTAEDVPSEAQPIPR